MALWHVNEHQALQNQIKLTKKNCHYGQLSRVCKSVLTALRLEFYALRYTIQDLNLKTFMFYYN